MALAGGAANGAGAVAPALVLHLFPTHFTLDERDATYQYNGPLKEFLEAINRQELPANAVDLFKESDFHNGCVNVEVRDHRVKFQSNGRMTASGTASTGPTRPYIRNLVLRPTPATLWADLGLLRTSAAEPLNQDAALEVEAKILLATRPTLNLDPNPAIGRQANIQHFNETKYRIARKRPRNWAAKEEDDEKKRQSDKMMLIMDERQVKEFHPKFATYTFVEDWKRKKAMADAEPLVTLEDKMKSKGSGKKPDANCNINVDSANLIRSLLYKQHFQSTNITMYTTVNVYQMSDGQCYCTLRWGNAPGTGTGQGRLTGSTLRFPLGNYAAAVYYIKSLKTHLMLSNVSIMDQIRPMGSAQASNAIAGQATMHGVSEHTMGRGAGVKGDGTGAASAGAAAGGTEGRTPAATKARSKARTKRQKADK
ncbi:Transcription factor spt20 [Geranomyces variabilis]|uniref:Transcription factor spt20 n=1 Tax=Geranomyces variabilis TaxID=109894 RepID=A0AAD5TL07_9FUNG|nr:Transcription factor spt20 [Geranomyces variabilis]